MELDRHNIERKDFTVARRGYDQEEVDLHLRQLADTIAELKAQLKATPAGVAGAAAEQVRQIVEVAEESAAQIEERAQDEARRVTDEASRRAREARDRADQESAEQLKRAQETAEAMLERADALESELNGLVEGIEQAASALVERMRTGAGQLDSDLESIRQELLAVRPVEPEPAAEQAAPAEVASATADRIEAPTPDTRHPTPPVAAEAATATETDERTEAPTPETRHPAPEPQGAGPEGARLVALNMALNGTPREEAARYLADNFQLEDQEAILDDVYSRVGGRA